MFRLCVFLEMIRSCCFILTVLTLKCFILMYGLYVPLEMVLLCELLTTARASNGFALLHRLSHYKMRTIFLITSYLLCSKSFQVPKSKNDNILTNS